MSRFRGGDDPIREAHQLMAAALDTAVIDISNAFRPRPDGRL